MENLVRALIVDDYAPWRRFLRQTLSAEKKIEIIGEAADGFEAVEKGGELQPDLILLDIGLPAMSGIEAARILRKVSSKTKIVFVSENRSPEIVQEVLRIGGSGYVLKSDAGRELVPSLRAVLEGKQFVSSSLFGVGAGILNRTQPRNSVAEVRVESPDVPHCHEAIFYL
jgi:DNA-binding NarL/FixJ family response regulator